MRVIFFHTDDKSSTTRALMKTWALYLGLKRDPALRKEVAAMLARGAHSVWSFPVEGPGEAHANWLCVWMPILDGLGARWMAWSDVRARATTIVSPKGAYDAHLASQEEWRAFNNPEPLPNTITSYDLT